VQRRGPLAVNDIDEGSGGDSHSGQYHPVSV
jgi:hypothetical protein